MPGCENSSGNNAPAIPAAQDDSSTRQMSPAPRLPPLHGSSPTPARKGRVQTPSLDTSVRTTRLAQQCSQVHPNRHLEAWICINFFRPLVPPSEPHRQNNLLANLRTRSVGSKPLPISAPRPRVTRHPPPPPSHRRHSPNHFRQRTAECHACASAGMGREQPGLVRMGRCSITANVDFTAIQAAGEAGGLETEDFLTQSQFLTRIAAQTWKSEGSFGEWTAERARQFQTLTHPELMGRSFRVPVTGRNLVFGTPACT